MNENRINLSIKPSNTPTQNQSHQIVNIGHFCYNPCDSVGLGYISNVYVGKNTKTNEKVAVKVIDTTEKDKLVLQFLESEVSMLKKIKNYGCQHLLLLEETFQIDNKVYIVTEFCEGKDLSKVLRHQKTFSDKDAQTIMKQVMKTYKELYDLGIVHRDLKLSNLLVKNGQIKLADFGFSLPIINCIQQFPYNAGSPFFMSPEALRRNRFSFESDIWALGIMAFQLVFGKLPFQEKVESLLYETIMKTNIQEKLQGIELSDAYKKFITKCLEKDMRIRATPEEVINYEWPLAQDQLPPCFRLESLQQTETPHLPQQFNTNITSTPRKHSDPLAGLLDQGKTLTSSLSASEVKTERIKIVQFRPRSNFFQGPVHQRKFQMIQNPPGSVPLIIRGPSRTFTEIPVRPPVMTKELSNKQILSDIFQRNQAIVAAIVEYCKFLFKLYLMLEQDSILPEGQKLKSEISYKILSNYSEVGKFLEGRQSKFGKIGAFSEFSQTQEYFKTRDTVGINSYFFNSKFKHLGMVENNPYILTNSINFLKDKIPSRFALTEELCHYLVLKQAETQGIDYFTAHSKLNWLNSRPQHRQVTLQDCNKLQRWVNQLIH